MTRDDQTLTPVEAVRFDVTGWGIDSDDPDLHQVRRALAGRRWPWVELRHMDHATGQEARVVETEDGYRLRFRRRHLAVTVTLLPEPDERDRDEGHPVGWHMIEEVTDVQRMGDQLSRRPELPAVIFQCAGCGNEARSSSITEPLLAVVAGWSGDGGRGKPRVNLVPGHLMKRTPEKVRERARRMHGF